MLNPSILCNTFSIPLYTLLLDFDIDELMCLLLKIIYQISRATYTVEFSSLHPPPKKIVLIF